MKVWKIQPTDGGWWLFHELRSPNPNNPYKIWWHAWGTSENRWSAVFPTLDEALQRIKDRETGTNFNRQGETK